MPLFIERRFGKMGATEAEAKADVDDDNDDDVTDGREGEMRIVFACACELIDESLASARQSKIRRRCDEIMILTAEFRLDL